MTRRVIISEAASADLQEIWFYSADQWGVAKADAYTDEIDALLEDLAEDRKAGRTVAERRGYYRYPIGRHVIFYMFTDESITVMRVLHQSMDTDRHL